MPTIDFDAARAERAEEPVKLIKDGVTYLLPPSIPAEVALDLIRLRAAHGEESQVPAEDVERMARALLGKDYDGLIRGLTLPDLEDLLKRLMAVYAPAPNRAARRAQKAATSR